MQIHSDAQAIGKYTGLKLAIVFGGVDYEKQRRILEEGVDVLIGTPGRIIDYFKQHVFDFGIFKWQCWMKPIGCSIWGSSRTSASSYGACRIRPSA